MNRYINLTGYLIVAITTMFGCKLQPQTSGFITVKNGKFIKNGKPYYYIGTNYWYGASIAADTIGGDRERLIKELDFLKQNGIDNLRVMVGAEGTGNEPFRVTPTLVKKPGVFSPALLEGLDYFLNELKKRNMVAILYFTNNWEWSGGMAQYVNWNGFGDYVNPNLEKYTWQDFYEYQKQFYTCEPCIEEVNQYIEKIITRTNTVNGINYINDPTIMAWELANEPRPMAIDNFEPFKKWIKETSVLIQSLDTNHLVTTGNEGEKGCSESIELFKVIHSLSSIDYITFHIWVKNWQWYKHEQAETTFPESIKLVKKYIDDHTAIAQKLNKPVVIEEFGIARDNESFLVGSPVTYRDTYFEFVFNEIAESINKSKNLVGCNIWTFGGFTHPIKGQIYWKPGNPYSGDPPQEQQGLNSVYPEDTSTINIIRKYNIQFNRIPKK